MTQIINAIPDNERADFFTKTSTIGSYILFPGKPVGGKSTINQERGRNGKIADRFDLTLECIRRHYKDEDSPLSAVLARYANFFALFGDFAGYVEFFLLQDLVSHDGEVQFWLPFDNFNRSPVPQSVEEYRTYRDAAVRFVGARNDRIAAIDRAADQ